MLLAEDMIGGAIHKVADPAKAGHRILLQPKTRVASVVMAKKTKEVADLLKTTPQQSDYTVRWEDEGEGASESKLQTGRAEGAHQERASGEACAFDPGSGNR